MLANNILVLGVRNVPVKPFKVSQINSKSENLNLIRRREGKEMQCIYLLKQFVYKYLSRFLQNTNENYNKKIKESVALHKGRIMITKKITKKSIIVISLS